MTLCRNFRATTGGLSELESNPANPARNTVIKSSSLCRHCHTQHPPPQFKKAAISHTIPSRSDPSNRSSPPSSRVIGVVGGMKWWVVGELAVVWSYVMIFKGLGAVVLAVVEGGCGWDFSFVPNPSHPSETGHSKATLQLNGENSNALENTGQWESPCNGSSPCL